MKILKALFNPRGGIHPEYAKGATAILPVETIPLSKTFYVSLAQHLGAPSRTIVKKGDTVLRGQVIAEPAGYVSSAVHAPTSGTVKNISGATTASGRVATVVEIEADGQDRACEPVAPISDWQQAEAKTLVDAVAKAGIIGMGGAGFPTHVKLTPPPGKKIDVLIINGAECEPFLTADHRLMVEQPARIIAGARIIRHIVGASRICIGIEDNKPDAIDVMSKALAQTGDDIEVVVLATRYPQGAEKQLIYSATGREVPSGGLPMDVNALVENVATAAAVGDAILNGQPLIERIITVTGDGIHSPKNIMARIGTPFRDLIAFCDGMTGEPGKLICGGPMMGIAQANADAAVGKTTSGLLLLGRGKITNFTAMACISCGRCVSACPSGLLPCILSEYLEAENYDETENYRVLDCIECGACAFECPSHRPLVQHMRTGKAQVIARRKQRESQRQKEAKPT